jgi:Flp pilus assembly protein protease CpaA
MKKMVDSVLAFAVTLVLLIIYSGFDIRERRVPNQVMIMGGIVGIAVNLLSGHLYQNLLLHLFALSFAIPLSYALFRLGAFGGADAKALISVALISPGFEFLFWIDPLIEAIIAMGIEVTFMLSLGYLWWYQTKKCNKEAFPPPLIPLLLVGYLFTASFMDMAYLF